MLKINFYPESEEFDHIPATKEYQEIWDKEGLRMISTIEAVSKLKFDREFLNVLVVKQTISRARPMALRSDYPTEIKKSTLVHELCHRLVRLYDRQHSFKTALDQHKDIDLILYDIWTEMYGKELADKWVEYESSRNVNTFYKEAWDWALSMTREERAEKFKKLAEKSKQS